jgi:hypothetical protein
MTPEQRERVLSHYTIEQRKIAGYLRAFWNTNVREQERNRYFEASCYVADFFAEIGITYDYGDGVYATSEKGRYYVDFPRLWDEELNWLEMAHELKHGSQVWYAQVIEECLDPETIIQEVVPFAPWTL